MPLLLLLKHGISDGIEARRRVDADISDAGSADRRLLMLTKYLENQVNVGGHLLLQPRQLPAIKLTH